MRLTYDSTDDDHYSPGPLRQWAADVVASRLNTSQLHVLSENVLPDGHLNAVYQKKLLLQTQAHCRELEKLDGKLRDQRVELRCRDMIEERRRRELLDLKSA